MQPVRQSTRTISMTLPKMIATVITYPNSSRMIAILAATRDLGLVYKSMRVSESMTTLIL